jgi:hypothetical protein
MRRFICLVGAIGLSASSIVSCSDDDLIVGPGTAGTGGSGGAGGRGGRGGSGGSGGSMAGSNAGGSGGSAAGAAGMAGAGGSAGSPAGDDAGSDAGTEEPDAGGPVLVDAGDAGPFISCVETSDCDDENLCTAEVCQDQVCVFAPAAIGTPCGDTSTENECNQPDTCDGSGVCLANTEPDGTLCEDGHCNIEGVCDCAIDRVTAVPYNQQWQTTGDGEIDVVFPTGCQECANSADHVVVFTAPETASYRFTATSLGYPELAVYESDCTGNLSAGSFECGLEVGDGNDISAQLDIELDEGESVSVIVAENCEENGGEGSLTIDLTP